MAMIFTLYAPTASKQVEPVSSPTSTGNGARRENLSRIGQKSEKTETVALLPGLSARTGHRATDLPQGKSRPEGARTNQPWATPWEAGRMRSTPPCKGPTRDPSPPRFVGFFSSDEGPDRWLVAPFQGFAVGGRLGSQGVALG